MKIHTVKVPLYFETLRIVVADDFKEAFHKLKIDYHKGMEEYASFVIPHTKYLYVFIHRKAPIGIISHESTHIVNYVFKKANISLDLDNDEPQAYLIGWVAETIHKYSK